jgi:hypothetical protein
VKFAVGDTCRTMYCSKQRHIDSCCSSNLPEILLVPFSCRLHKVRTLLVKHQLTFNIRCRCRCSWNHCVVTPKIFNICVSTTGDSLIGCQIFQHRLALAVYRYCLHSTFPQQLYVTLIRHESLYAVHTRKGATPF